MTTDFVNTTTFNQKRLYGVQVLDSAGTPITGAVVQFELLGTPTWLTLDTSLSMGDMAGGAAQTATRDLNPKYATTDSRDGVALAWLTFPNQSETTVLSPDTLCGTYTLRAWYKGRHVDLPCSYETPCSLIRPVGEIWIKDLGGSSVGRGTNSLLVPQAIASNASIIFNTCDVAHCPLGAVPFTVTFVPVTGAFNATYATGFGLIDPAVYADPIGSTLLQTYNAQTSAYTQFYQSDSKAYCGNSSKTQAAYTLKIRNKTGGSLDARLDFTNVTKNGATKTMSAWFRVANAAS